LLRGVLDIRDECIIEDNYNDNFSGESNIVVETIIFFKDVSYNVEETNSFTFMSKNIDVEGY